MTLTRLLRGYDKNGDALKLEIALPTGIELSLLQEIFDIESDNPMYDCYPVNKMNVKSVEEHFGIHVPIDEFDFFLECYGED